MPKISPLLLLTAAIFTASSAYALPQRASTPSDLSFSVFFDSGGAVLSKEGREIVAIAAKRFEATHSRYPAAHIFVSGQTNEEQDSASLSIKRANAVGNELMRDGIQRKFVTVDERPGLHSEPVRLLEWLDRRVSISIQENPAPGRILG